MPTSDIMFMLAEEKLDVVVHADTFEPYLFDNIAKEFYYIPEEVGHWRHYIWTYNCNRPSWSKFYEVKN